MSQPTKESLAGKVVALNEQFLQYLQSQDKKTVWLDAVADYREYAEAIAKELESVSTSSAAKAPEPNKPAGSGLFNFTNQSAATATATTTSQPVGFGGFSAAPAPISVKPAPEVVVLDDAEEEEKANEDSEQPQIDDTNAADILFTKKVHLLTQDSETKKWKDKGTGTFSLRKSKDSGDGKRVAYIVFTAATGKVLINAPVIKGMKPMINAKANSNVIMFLISRDDSGVENKQMHLFKCGNSETAAELTAAVSAEA